MGTSTAAMTQTTAAAILPGIRYGTNRRLQRKRSSAVIVLTLDERVGENKKSDADSGAKEQRSSSRATVSVVYLIVATLRSSDRDITKKRIELRVLPRRGDLRSSNKRTERNETKVEKSDEVVAATTTPASSAAEKLMMTLVMMCRNTHTSQISPAVTETTMLQNITNNVTRLRS